MNEYSQLKPVNYNNLYQNVWGSNYHIQPLRALRYHFVGKALRRLADHYRVKNALDIGCGVGEVIKLIVASWKDIEVTGFDISEEAIQLAREHCPGIYFLVSDMESFESENRYDLITAIDVIEHIKDDMAAIKKINNLLNDNGILVLSLPNMMRYWSKDDERGGHYRRYSKKEIIKKLQTSGFSIVKIRSYGFPFPVIYHYIKNCLNKTQRFNENRLVKTPNRLVRTISSIIKHIFLLSDIDIGLGIHMLVIATKTSKGS